VLVSVVVVAKTIPLQHLGQELQELQEFRSSRMGIRESHGASGSPANRRSASTPKLGVTGVAGVPEWESGRVMVPAAVQRTGAARALHHSITPPLLPHPCWIFRAVTCGSFRYNGSSEGTKLCRHLIRYSASGGRIGRSGEPGIGPTAKIGAPPNNGCKT
jgi:hypothetical protein